MWAGTLFLVGRGTSNLNKKYLLEAAICHCFKVTCCSEIEFCTTTKSFYVKMSLPISDMYLFSIP